MLLVIVFFLLLFVILLTAWVAFAQTPLERDVSVMNGFAHCLQFCVSTERKRNQFSAAAVQAIIELKSDPKL